jgi:hypothetical protein
VIGRSTGVARALVLAAAFALGLVACGVDRSPSPIPSPTASPFPTASVTQTPPSASSDGAVAIDATLLEVLPAAVDGIAFAESADGEAEALGDPALAAVGERFAAALAIDAASGEFAYAVVVALHPGVMTDELFRDWRDSYDEGACSQAGGVVGRAEAQIGGRTVHIGSCAGGVRTYHVWLREPALLVSASAVGERRLGERLVEGLRP